jgi:hypothetical protein
MILIPGYMFARNLVFVLLEKPATKSGSSGENNISKRYFPIGNTDRILARSTKKSNPNQ